MCTLVAILDQVGLRCAALICAFFAPVAPAGQNAPLDPDITIAAHELQAFDAVFSPDGRTLATCSRDKTVKIWDGTSGSPVRTLEMQPGRMEALAFSPEGEFLASGGEFNRVAIWNTADWSLRQTFTVKGRTTVSCLAFSPSGRLLAAGTEDKAVTVWEWESGRSEAYLRGHTAGVTALNFESDTRLHATAGDSVSRIWDITTGKYTEPIKIPLGDGWISLLSPDTKYWATAYFSPFFPSSGVKSDPGIKIWDGSTGKIIHSFRSGFLDAPVAYSPDSRFLLVRSYGDLGSDIFSERLVLWEVRTARRLAALNAPATVRFGFAPEGSLIAATGLDGTVRIWRAASFKR